ncbi:hypothetical protein MTO96_001576 [Rhipicephalus appendiculatus]
MGEESVMESGVSSMSEMSGVQSGQAEEAVEESGNKKILAAIGACLVMLAVVGFLVLLDAESNDVENTEPDGHGGGEGGEDGPGPSYVKPPSSPPPSTTEATVVKEIFCTVGHGAVEPTLYPPDAMCDYLYYTHVVVIDKKIRATEIETSWTTFKTMAKTYKRVLLGISFHYLYLGSLDVVHPSPDFADLQNNYKIDSYGTLNIIAKPGVLQNTVYNVRDFNVDTVFAITSVGLQDTSDKCYSLPPNILSTVMNKYPSLLDHWELVTTKMAYKNKATVGVSFEMGTMMYWLKQAATSVDGSIYKECNAVSMTSRDAICDSTSKILSPALVQGGYVFSTRQDLVVFSEYTRTLVDKLQYAKDDGEKKGQPLRRRVALLLFNLHLEDVQRRCDTPYSNLNVTCEAFKGQGKGTNKIFVAAVAACILLLAVIGVLAFLGWDSNDVDDTDKEGNGGGEDGPGPSYVKPTPPPPAASTTKGGRRTLLRHACYDRLHGRVVFAAVPTPPSKTTPSTTPKSTTKSSTKSTTATTTTTPEPELKEILCTVGHSAVTPNMYPPEFPCDYLYYTSVFVLNRKIIATKVQASWTTFQAVAKNYTRLIAGMSFDYGYFSHHKLVPALADFTALNAAGIGSYGILNIMTSPADLRTTTLKRWQGASPIRRSVIALGSTDYSGANYAHTFKNLVKSVVKYVMASSSV